MSNLDKQIQRHIELNLDRTMKKVDNHKLNHFDLLPVMTSLIHYAKTDNPTQFIRVANGYLNVMKKSPEYEGFNPHDSMDIILENFEQGRLTTAGPGYVPKDRSEEILETQAYFRKYFGAMLSGDLKGLKE